MTRLISVFVMALFVVAALSSAASACMRDNVTAQSATKTVVGSIATPPMTPIPPTTTTKTGG